MMLDLMAKEVEARAPKDAFKGCKLNCTHPSRNIMLGLKQLRFNRKPKLEDKQLGNKMAESTLRTNAGNELTAKLIQQHEEPINAQARHAKDSRHVCESSVKTRLLGFVLVITS